MPVHNKPAYDIIGIERMFRFFLIFGFLLLVLIFALSFNSLKRNKFKFDIF